MKFIVTLTASLLLVTKIFSQVDSQFLPVVTDYPHIYANAIQPDGKVLVCGERLISGNSAPQPLLRLNPDGSKDTSFNPPVFSERDYIFSVVLENNGKIMIGGGLSMEFSSKPLVLRLNSDGTKDPTFILSSQITQAVYQIVSLSDGGYLIFSSSARVIAKVKSNGELDTSFNAGSGPNSYGLGNGDIAVQTDGKIIVAGVFSEFSGTPANKIIRLNSNGSIDNTFSIGTGPAGNNPMIKSIALDGDKIILVGQFTSFNSVSAVNIVRLLPSGEVDPNFVYPGPTGNLFDSKIDRVKLHNGGILVGGIKFDNTIIYYSLLKLRMDGSLETSFPIIDGKLSVNAGVIDPPIITTTASKILLSGYFDNIGAIAKRGIALIDENGLLISTFNPTVGGIAEVWSSKTQADGKIIIGGKFNHIGNTYCNNLMRLNPNGSVDESFRINLGSGFNRNVSSIEILSNGKILVGGSFDKVNGVDKLLLVCLNTDGTVDNTFIHNLTNYSIGVGVNDIMVLPSGKILVGGGFSFSSGTKYNLVRLNSNGSVDATFNTSMLTFDERVNSIALQSDNHLLIGGNNTYQHGFLKRTTFDGVVENMLSSLSLEYYPVLTLHVLPNDEFLMAGYFTGEHGTTTPNPLYQFSKEGTLKDKLSVAVYDGNIFDIQSIDNENILLAGSFKRINNYPIASFAKVKLNGGVETLFDYSVGGDIYNLEKESTASNAFCIMGRFYSIYNTQSFHIAKVNFDIPKAPIDLAYTTDNTEGKIFLEWKDKSFNETGFQILRSEGTGYVAIDSVATGVLKFTDSTALPLKSYTYKVGAFNTSFQSTFSNENIVSTAAWVPPNAPTGFQYTISSDFDSGILTWTDASTNEKGFTIERSLDQAAYTPLIQLQKNVVTYSDALSIGKLHRYRLRAFNKFGASNYTQVVELPVIAALPETSTVGISIYPNPTADKIWVSQNNPESIMIMVYDFQGKLLHHETSHEKIIGINLYDKSRGLYIVKILKDNNSLQTYKVIKK